MKEILRFGVVVGGLLFCFGCGGGGPAPAEAEAEAEKLQQDPDYEKEMMGEMSGSGEKSNP